MSVSKFNNFFFFFRENLKILPKNGGIHGQKFGRKWLNDGFSGNTPIFFYFLLTIFIETRTKNGGIHVFLEIITWKPVVVFIETRVFFGGLEAEGLQVHQKITRVPMNTTTGFQVIISKVTRKYHHFFVHVSLNTVSKNKIKHERVSYETIH